MRAVSSRQKSDKIIPLHHTTKTPRLLCTRRCRRRGRTTFPLYTSGHGIWYKDSIRGFLWTHYYKMQPTIPPHRLACHPNEAHKLERTQGLKLPQQPHPEQAPGVSGTIPYPNENPGTDRTSWMSCCSFLTARTPLSETALPPQCRNSFPDRVPRAHGCPGELDFELEGGLFPL